MLYYGTMKSSLIQRLNTGNPLLGTVITLPSPEVAEIIISAGFEWLFIDLEHTVIDPRDAQRILQAVPPGAFGVIRIPSLEEGWIKKCLDTGADGIIVPQVRTADDAERAVRFSKYPPAGERSIGISRAHGYGADFEEYVAGANDRTALIIQIEHIDGVGEIDTILKVPGIDCIFIGPYDLSGSMGKTGKVTDPEVLEAVGAVRDAANHAGVPIGIFGASADSVVPYIEQGYTLIAVGMDITIFASSVRGIIEDLKGRKRTENE
jgi:2-keto-3-deoxy-L-rhamnonate aldolase RhmA